MFLFCLNMDNFVHPSYSCFFSSTLCVTWYSSLHGCLALTLRGQTREELVS